MKQTYTVLRIKSISEISLDKPEIVTFIDCFIGYLTMLYKLVYSAPIIIRVIKSGRMRCAEYVARMGKMINAYSISASKNIVRVIKSRRMRSVGHVARMGEGRGVYRVSVGKPEGKRPLGKTRRRCEDNIKRDLRETGIDGANWIQLAQDSVQWRRACVNTVMNFRVS
jgi:hypothetical protein